MTLIKIKSLSTFISICFLIFIISLLFLPNPTMLSGHAIPDVYTLEPNSLFKISGSFPSNISILFSERPDPKASYIHVTNSEGKRIDNDDFKITGVYDRKGTVTLDKTLIGKDVYSVSWGALSLDDGHVSKGTYVVGVGDFLPSNNVIKNVTNNNTYTPVLGVVKVPIVIGQVYILGFIFSQLFLCKDIYRRGLRNIYDFIIIRRFTTTIITIAITMGVASTLMPVFQSIVISENQSGYMKNLALLYFGTTNGQVWLVRVISCAILAFGAYYYSRQVENDMNENNSTRSHLKGTILLYLLLISISVFIAVNSLTSHSSAIPTWSQLGVLFDFIHSFVVSIWIGGLMYISYVFLPKLIAISKNISLRGHQIIALPQSILLLILSRLSVTSAICVGIVGLTGLSLAWFHIHSMDELLTSDYGRTLIIKLSLVLPVIILGGYHQFWISRKMKMLHFEQENKDHGNDVIFTESFSSLKSTIKIECIFAAGVICAASFLTVTSPPSLQINEVNQADFNNHTPSISRSEFIKTVETQGTPIRLVISPFVTGFNNFTVNSLGSNESISQVSNVSIELRKSDLSLGPIYAKLIKNNDTAYSIYGGYLSQAGEWDLKVTIQRFNLYDLNYRLNFMVKNGSDTLRNQYEIDTVKIEDKTKNQANLDLMIILLSLIVIALSTYFSIKALERLRIAQQGFGLRI